jgi:hypothetical protein
VINSSVWNYLEHTLKPRWLSLPLWMATLVCVFLNFCSGCGYPEVGPKAYEISKALYSTCNLKRENDLDRVSEIIEQAASASEISESESEWLMAIVAQAKAGDWAAAEQEVRSILEDQTDL